MFEVLEPGLLTTVQDRGRPASTHLGVPEGGAADRRSLAVANLLLDNDPGAAAIEMTIVGPTLVARQRGVIAIGGADLAGRIRESGAQLVPGRTHAVGEGATLEFPGAVDPRAGARSYLAICGGVDVPVVLGSRSTCLAGGFGGLDGRPLARGDRFRASSPEAGADLVGRIWPLAGDGAGSTADPAADPSGSPFRVLPGPSISLEPRELDRLAEAIAGTTWRVAPESDRTGIRLVGPVPVTSGNASRSGILSHGVVTGTIQLPPDGLPIVLLVDHQTTGGYPVAAVVIAADHDRLGQLRPGAEIGFSLVDRETATAALVRHATDLADALAVFREGIAWDDAWRSTRG